MDQDNWLTIDKLAEYLKMRRTNPYRTTQDGEILASKVGNQWRFNKEQIDVWMKGQRPTASSKSNKGGSR